MIRVAITGSSGTGKSTLAAKLGAELGLPVIPEGMREYLERTKTDLHSLGHEGLKLLVKALWEERQEAYARATRGFVADRSSYDFAAFWLFYGFAMEGEETTHLMETLLVPDRYSRLIVLPWGGIPLVADGVRTPNRWVQLHYQSLIEGLLGRFVEPHQIGVVSSLVATTLEGRVQEVLSTLRA